MALMPWGIFVLTLSFIVIYSTFACKLHTPWARSFWAFSPYLNHMRKFSHLYIFETFLPFSLRFQNKVVTLQSG